jgi:hypothetical protein
MAHCIHLVGYTFIPQGGYLRFKEAVESGFLLGFVSWTIRDNSDAGFVGKMFKTTFPAFTIYHSILSPLKERLTEVREAAKEEGFINSDIYSHWWSFVRLAETRIMIMEKYDSRAVVSLQGCDNVQVSVLRLVRTQLTSFKVSTNSGKEALSPLCGLPDLLLLLQGVPDSALEERWPSRAL